MDTRPTPPAALDGLNPLLLDKYCAGTCLPAELREIEAWIAGRPDRKAVLTGVRLGLVNPVYPTMISSDEMNVRLDSVIGVSPSTRVVMRANSAGRGMGGKARLGTQTLQSGMAYAAVGVVVGVLGLLMGWQGIAHRFVKATSLAVSTYATKNGQRATITLLDGTTVALDVASRLDVPADFATGNHTVHLTGEALFTVSHHEGTPFTVIVDSTAVRVLGTTFLVRRYATDTATTVAVHDGRVMVGTTVVGAQRLVEVGPHGVSKLQIASASVFGFATGTLSLSYMPLSAAIPELNRWYDAEVRMADSTLASQGIDGEFEAGSLADLANILKLTFDVRVVRDGRVLTLYPRSPK